MLQKSEKFIFFIQRRKIQREKLSFFKSQDDFIVRKYSFFIAYKFLVFKGFGTAVFFVLLLLNHCSYWLSVLSVSAYTTF